MVIEIFLLFGSTTGIAGGDLSDRLLVDAQAAVVEIDSVSNNRQLIALPTLQFSLVLEPVCAATAHIESISVSAADTRQTYGVDDIGKQPVVEATLSIPGKQLGPIRIGDFCRTTVASTAETRELTIEGALTAHLSLRCASDEEHSITYVSQALDIILQCNRVDDAAVPNGSSENQVSPAEPEPRF